MAEIVFGLKKFDMCVFQNFNMVLYIYEMGLATRTDSLIGDLLVDAVTCRVSRPRSTFCLLHGSSL